MPGVACCLSEPWAFSPPSLGCTGAQKKKIYGSKEQLKYTDPALELHQMAEEHLEFSLGWRCY